MTDSMRAVETQLHGKEERLDACLIASAVGSRAVDSRGLLSPQLMSVLVAPAGHIGATLQVLPDGDRARKNSANHLLPEPFYFRRV